MSKGYWRTAIIAGLTLLAAFVVGGYLLGLQLGKEAGEHQANTDTYAKHAADEIESACFGLDTVAESKCIIRVIEATNEHERAESDLIAQRNMARWALMMLVATVLMAGITAYGVYYVWQTLNVTRDIGQAQVRAYISIKPNHISFLKTGSASKFKFVIKCLVQNSGSSPAQKAELLFNAFQEVDTLSARRVDEAELGSDVSISDIAANSTIESTLSTTVVLDFDRLLQAEDRVVFYILLKFKDVFGRSHIHEHVATIDGGWSDLKHISQGTKTLSLPNFYSQVKMSQERGTND